MLSKNKQKLIQSLAKKKVRDELKLFVAEGDKIVNDLLNTSLQVKEIFATEEWIKQNSTILASSYEVTTVDQGELKKISQLVSTPCVLVLFNQPIPKFDINQLKTELTLFLDDVQDPGNLGTIIRLADWFGINHIICTQGCADVFNHKTIQSTMGAIARVACHYQDKTTFFEAATTLQIPIYGTFLEGENIYSEPLNPYGIIVMGNEGKGISEQLHRYITHKLFIPPYPIGGSSSESLNVSVATAIVCSEFRRRLG